MNVNGVSNGAAADAAYTTHRKSTDKKEKAVSKETAADKGAVYEASPRTEKKSYATNTNAISRLKAEADEKTAQFRELVKKLFSQQANTADIADSVWKQFASGNFTADADTIKQAQADIAEDGYWGVAQTADRIFSFAEALSGGDPEKMEKMIDAFKKGYDQATKAWGKELPDISSKTYDAVMKKFDDYKKETT